MTALRKVAKLFMWEPRGPDLDSSCLRLTWQGREVLSAAASLRCARVARAGRRGCLPTRSLQHEAAAVLLVITAFDSVAQAAFVGRFAGSHLQRYRAAAL